MKAHFCFYPVCEALLHGDDLVNQQLMHMNENISQDQTWDQEEDLLVLELFSLFPLSLLLLSPSVSLCLALSLSLSFLFKPPTCWGGNLGHNIY